jgi:hypothetical protein
VYRLSCALLVSAILLGACGNGGAATQAAQLSAMQSAAAAMPVRRGFLGAFFRSAGPPPFGVTSIFAKVRPPEPYPTPGTILFGKSGYCDQVAANGLSISTGYAVDATKLADIVNLGVKWTRTEVSSNFDDQSHVFGRYAFADFDAAQCALIRSHITPIVGIEAGAVQYDAIPDQYSPKVLPNYPTAAAFGQWCGVIARHEKDTFASVTRFSEPGNEVNSDPKTFPGGEAEIAAYTAACYRAIKAELPKSVVYGFELNMDRHIDALAFIGHLYALGCKVGTCYDALSIHMFMPYPIPPDTEPCYPNYSPQCVVAVQTAAHAPDLHVLIGETAFMIPRTIPDEATKAVATVQAMQRFAAYKQVDGVNYANVDECDLYPSGPFVAGCLIDSLGHKLPAYGALAAVAKKSF